METLSSINDPGMQSDVASPLESAPPSMDKSEISGAALNAMEDPGLQEKLKYTGGNEIASTLVNDMNDAKELKSLKSEEVEISGIAVNEIEKFEELEEWKEKVAKAEKKKSEMLLSKLTADSMRKQYEVELAKLKDEERWIPMKRQAVQEHNQKALALINEQNDNLRKEIQLLKKKLAEENAKYEEHAQCFQFRRNIPEKKMKFVRLENIRNIESYMNVACCVRLASKIPFKLSRGEALITFDEEDGKKVVQGLISKHTHYMSMENKKILVKAQPVTLETGITFELHANISRREVSVSNIPELNISEEWMRDKLELNLRRAKLGEVNHVIYDKKSQTALVTFDSAIADNDIMRCGQCPFHANGQTSSIKISPIKQMKLEDFQIYSGISRRTMLLTGIKVAEEDEESAEEMVTIHFQKPSNGGGEVENVKYISNGSKIVYFENDQ